VRLSGAAIVALAVISACGGSGTFPAPPPPPDQFVDLSGTWSGTWSGSNTVQGFVTGTWEANVIHTPSALTGTVVLAGDIDCPDATLGPPLAGAPGDGSISRPPCQPNTWTHRARSRPPHHERRVDGGSHHQVLPRPRRQP